MAAVAETLEGFVVPTEMLGDTRRTKEPDPAGIFNVEVVGVKTSQFDDGVVVLNWDFRIIGPTHENKRIFRAVRLGNEDPERNRKEQLKLNKILRAVGTTEEEHGILASGGAVDFKGRKANLKISEEQSFTNAEGQEISFQRYDFSPYSNLTD